jgi:hypothetical protein
MKKKLIIIDQSFKDYTGHHYNYNKYLYDNFKNFFKISFYVNQDIRNDINEVFDKTLFNIFKKTSYSSNYKLIFLKKIKKFIIFRYLFFFIIKYNFAFNILLKFYSRKFLVTDFYNKLLSLVKNKSNSIFFIHSLSENEFLETLMYLYNNNNNNNNNKFYLVYRRDPIFLKKYFLILNKVIDNDRIYLLTDSFKIKKYLEKEIKKKICLINIPVNINYKKKKRSTNKKKKKFIISYLGDARLEKGFFSIPSYIKKLNLNKRYQFIVQANSNGYNLDLYNETVSILKKIKNVKLLERQLDENQYLKVLFESDIIFLPYKSEFYEYRTSSIFYEGIYAEKIVIVTPDTWMSSFYQNNLVLKNLILSKKDNLNENLKYINKNYHLIIKNILLLKKNILMKNNIYPLKKLFQNSRSHRVLVKNNAKFISYLVDENTINRREDGNQFGTLNIIKNIFDNKILLKKNFNFNILFNRNFDSQYALFTMNNVLRLFNIKNINFNLCPCISRFILNNNILNYNLNLKEQDLIFKDILLLNYHFYVNQFKKINHLKKIILVHDLYSKVNFRRQFFDNKNNHYIFVSYNEFLKTHFLKAKKYLIFPIYIDNVIKNNNLSKKFKKYNYIFISSGSEVDKANLEIMLKEINRPINLFGDICYKLDSDFLILNSHNLILKGFVNNLQEYFNNPKNIFFIPRHKGIGIPIKFLQLIKFRSKVIFFGNSDSFGLPDNLIKDFIFNKSKNLSLEDFVNNLNYKKLYNNISRFIKSSNNKNKNKLIENVIC